MKAFKGFNKDLTCRGFQYEEGKEFHTEKAECCEEGRISGMQRAITGLKRIRSGE